VLFGDVTIATVVVVVPVLYAVCVRNLKIVL